MIYNGIQQYENVHGLFLRLIHRFYTSGCHDLCYEIKNYFFKWDRVLAYLVQIMIKRRIYTM